MQVRVKLMGLLKEKTPPGDKIDLPDGATIEGALGLLDIATSKVQIVSINGELERDFSRRLEADDELTVLTPVVGG